LTEVTKVCYRYLVPHLPEYEMTLNITQPPITIYNLQGNIWTAHTWFCAKIQGNSSFFRWWFWKKFSPYIQVNHWRG